MIKEFPNGARVAFIGDSITAANITLPHIIRAYSAQRPDRTVRFFNCGVAGGTAEFATISYARDIARHSPTHAVVAFGINDSNRDLLNAPRSSERLDALTAAYEVYKLKLRELVERLLRDGVEVILCTPVPYDEYSDSPMPPLRGGFALMQGYAEYVRGLAAELGVTLYDQHKIISSLLETEAIISEDRIHPTDHGYFALARELLAQQGIEIEELPIPDGFAEWHSYVARLRKVLAAECMIVRDFDMPTADKLEMMRKKVENSDWGQPVFESFIRDYVRDKLSEEDFYKEIDELYESDVMK